MKRFSLKKILAIASIIGGVILLAIYLYKWIPFDLKGLSQFIVLWVYGGFFIAIALISIGTIALCELHDKQKELPVSFDLDLDMKNKNIYGKIFTFSSRNKCNVLLLNGKSVTILQK